MSGYSVSLNITSGASVSNPQKALHFQVVCSDFSTRSMSASGIPVAKSKAGGPLPDHRIAQPIMSATDAHVKLCNTLMAADRMWEATIDMLTDAIYIFGPDKRLKKINRGGETLERASRSFLIGRRCCDMLWGLDGAGCMVDRAMTNGAEVEVEL